MGNPFGVPTNVGLDVSDGLLRVIAGTAGTVVGVTGVPLAKWLGVIGLAPVAVGVCWVDVGVW